MTWPRLEYSSLHVWLFFHRHPDRESASGGTLTGKPRPYASVGHWLPSLPHCAGTLRGRRCRSSLGSQSRIKPVEEPLCHWRGGTRSGNYEIVGRWASEGRRGVSSQGRQARPRRRDQGSVCGVREASRAACWTDLACPPPPALVRHADVKVTRAGSRHLAKPRADSTRIPNVLCHPLCHAMLTKNALCGC